MDIEEAWDYLTSEGIATEDELQLISNGWGYTLENMETVLYARTGYRSFEQMEAQL